MSAITVQNTVNTTNLYKITQFNSEFNPQFFIHNKKLLKYVGCIKEVRGLGRASKKFVRHYVDSFENSQLTFMVLEGQESL